LRKKLNKSSENTRYRYIFIYMYIRIMQELFINRCTIKDYETELYKIEKSMLFLFFYLLIEQRLLFIKLNYYEKNEKRRCPRCGRNVI
jgi:hypothetical protein